MDATRIEEVIGEFVSLKKRGGNHIGCCPFHNEKTPSFYVSPGKGIYKCFGCGKAGNAVGFLMDYEHYTYPEALRYLANKYNIEIEEERMTDEQRERQSERDGLFHVSEFAQKYFADLLHHDETGVAVGLSYFHQRGLSDDIINTFGLGYCLDEWSNFTDHARKNGYSDSVLEKTGLTVFRDEGGAYDRFRGRVMFPVYSISGRVIGFCGRVLTSGKQTAKYINSPDSDIYDKGHTLYGIYQARNAISRADKCYLVEGNVDVVSMHQSGVCNTVASCGTSLTSDQIRLIKRYTRNVTVLYDGDAAGIKATLRAVDLLFAEEMHVRMVLFPDQEDPDSYAQKYGSTQLQTYLKEHEEGFVAYKKRTLNLGDNEILDPIRKTEVLTDMVRSIALVQNPIEQQEYIRETASMLRMREDVLMQTLAKAIADMKRQAWKEEQREQARAQAAQSNPTDGQPGGAAPPPLEPTDDELDALYPTPEAATAPAQVLPDLRPAETQERKIVTLLINYGNAEVPQEGVDEKGNPTTFTCTVAQAIVAEIAGDELTFDNPVYQQIFDLYHQAIDNHQALPDANLFVTSDDTLLRNTALELMINKYNISKLWLERKSISIPTPEHNLRTDMEESILTFKQKKLDRQLENNSYQIRECKNDDDMLILIAERENMLSLRKAICERLHRVIV